VLPRSVECQCLSGGLGQRTGRSSSYSVRIRSGTRRRLSRPRCRCSRGGHLKSGEARTSRPQRPVPEQLAGCSYSRPRTRAAPCRWACMPAKCRRGHWRSPRKAESPPQGRRSLGLPFSSAVEHANASATRRRMRLRSAFCQLAGDQPRLPRIQGLEVLAHGRAFDPLISPHAKQGRQAGFLISYSPVAVLGFNGSPLPAGSLGRPAGWGPLRSFPYGRPDVRPTVAFNKNRRISGH
jgi:hypothetical protein